jgi:signal transduction histidine kinase
LPNFTFKQLNLSWQNALGFELGELTGASLASLIHPDDLAQTMKALEGGAAKPGGSIVFQNRLRAKTGPYRCLWWTSVVDRKTGCVYCVVRDVTDQRVLEAELAQSQKLEAVGQLASGVAHEINSPIQFVGDNVEFVHTSFGDLMTLLDQVDALTSQSSITAAELSAVRAAATKADLSFLREEIPKSLTEARDGVRRVAELVRALKEFAHADRPEMVPANLNQAIERSLVLARHEVKYVADLESNLGLVPTVECHMGALNQVFLNLFINAGHAIEDRRAKTEGAKERGLISVSTALDGDHVVVAIRDTGCGIPPEVQPRIFEPFFTTKEVGRGSGQGLALARAIVVDRHHGQLSFETRVGEGTTFFVRLPVHQSSVGSTS